MTNMQKLVSIAAEPHAPRPVVMPELLLPYSLGSELLQMLQLKNGFYAFESALHVFPLTGDARTGLEAWNAGPLWKNDYRDLAEGLLFFAEDIFQDQFCMSPTQNGIFRFYAETGQTELLANSIEEWAGIILSNHRKETGWPLMHEWQAQNGPLQPGKRLMPKIPFFLGGEYRVENLWAGDALQGMKLKADLAAQTRNLPEGAAVKLNLAPRREQ